MKQTQTQKLIAALQRRPLTYLDMMRASGSLSPQRRCAEWLARHPEFKLCKGERGGLVTWRLRRAA